MRGNQPTATQEVPQSSFALTILPGTAPARVRKERAPKDETPAQPKEAKLPKEPKLPKEAKLPKEPKQPKEPRAPRFTLRAHKVPVAVDVASPVEVAASFETAPSFEAAPSFETPEPVEVTAPAEFTPSATETFSPPPQQFSAPPPPAQFSPAPPQQFAPPPAQSTAPPAQFAPTADPFAHLSPPPVHEEPAVQGWYAPVESLAPEAPAVDYPPPTAYPMAPGYPAQPQYAEQSHFGYPQQAPPQADPQQFVGNPNLNTFAPPPPVGSWVPQHAAPVAGSSRSGLSGAAKVLIGIAIALVVVGVLYAIGKPMLVHKAANRNVVLPTTLVDEQQDHDATLDAATASVVAGLKQNPIGFSQVQSAYYGVSGDGTPLFMVAAGKLPTKPTAAETKAYFSTDADTAAEQLVLTPTGSGPFGGSMKCGHANLDGVATNVCSSIDDAAGVLVLSQSIPTSQLAVLARQIIGSVETKG